ncbi:DUF7504 family protein [Haloarchaeobius baliensis]|uniref:DUF7504 family protein n=1 Tax=Haloarchaeobius baliensis TaxID=1670458 RepID=UPI003F882A01
MVTYPPDEAADGVPVVETVPDTNGGQTILVVGEASDAATVVANRLLFTHGGQGRLQLLVSTRARESGQTRHPAVETIDYRPEPAPAQEPRTETEGTDVVDGRLTSLGTTVSRRILEFRRPLDGQVDLRLCVDSLTDLLASHDRETVFRFVTTMAGQIRRVGGSGQFHLPLPWDADEAIRLAPLFDAVMEVRAVDGRYEYRWLLGGGAAEWRAI